MSILIKGIEMPKNCLNCPMCNGNDECVLQSEEDNALFRTWKEQKDGCPLVEVPAPHGRLIDEDSVIDAILERLQVLRTHKEFIKKHEDIDLIGVMPYIAKIPTVIEAERTE